jgi:hypothetical protein
MAAMLALSSWNAHALEENGFLYGSPLELVQKLQAKTSLFRLGTCLVEIKTVEDKTDCLEGKGCGVKVMAYAEDRYNGNHAVGAFGLSAESLYGANSEARSSQVHQLSRSWDYNHERYYQLLNLRYDRQGLLTHVDLYEGRSHGPAYRRRTLCRKPLNQ